MNTSASNKQSGNSLQLASTRAPQVIDLRDRVTDRCLLGAHGPRVGLVGWNASVLAEASTHDSQGIALVDAAVQAGVTYLEIGDGDGQGRAAQIIGRYRAIEPAAQVIVAVKIGSQEPSGTASFSERNISRWVDVSRRYLRRDCLDLVFLQCPPSAVYTRGVAFDALDRLVKRGAIAAYGVSVRSAAEAMVALTRPHVSAIQLVVSVFQPEALIRAIPTAAKAGVGVVVRAPLAGGVLSAPPEQITERFQPVVQVASTLQVEPHVLVEAVQRLASIAGLDRTVFELAMRWLADQPGISVIAPHARTSQQLRSATAIATMPALSVSQHEAIAEVYDQLTAKASVRE